MISGRQDISKLMSLQDKGPATPPPGIYKRKPSPGGTGGKEDDDGMEHLDDEVSDEIINKSPPVLPAL